MTQQQSAPVLSGQIDCLTCHVWESQSHSLSSSFLVWHPPCLPLGSVVPLTLRLLRARSSTALLYGLIQFRAMLELSPPRGRKPPVLSLRLSPYSEQWGTLAGLRESGQTCLFLRQHCRFHSQWYELQSYWLFILMVWSQDLSSSATHFGSSCLFYPWYSQVDWPLFIFLFFQGCCQSTAFWKCL